jgi:REP element-mobilizing transposase RayT
VTSSAKARHPIRANAQRVRKHLRRLEQIWVESEIHLVNICTHRRQPVLACDTVAPELVSVLRDVSATTAWCVGRYVIMPDHVHFFCWRTGETHSLCDFVGQWKSWTTHRAWELGHEGRLWQSEFFDHLLRDEESYTEKWEYVRQNPVRAGLCETPDDWPYQGEITSAGT